MGLADRFGVDIASGLVVNIAMDLAEDMTVGLAVRFVVYRKACRGSRHAMAWNSPWHAMGIANSGKPFPWRVVGFSMVPLRNCHGACHGSRTVVC